MSKYPKVAALPLEAFFSFSFKGLIFLGSISLWRLVLHSSKIVIKLSRTSEDLNCKGGSHIGPAVSEILRYTQKDTHRNKHPVTFMSG